MNVAIFGGTGYVGGYLVDALLRAGHGVSVLVRRGSEGKLRNATECRLGEGDLTDKGAIRATVEGCAAVIYNVGLLREFPSQGITFEDGHALFWPHDSYKAPKKVILSQQFDALMDDAHW